MDEYMNNIGCIPYTAISELCLCMMMSSNGNILRVIGPLWGSPQETPTKASDAEIWCLLLMWAWTNDWANSSDAGDLIHYGAHCNVIVINCRPSLYNCLVRKSYSCGKIRHLGSSTSHLLIFMGVYWTLTAFLFSYKSELLWTLKDLLVPMWSCQVLSLNSINYYFGMQARYCNIFPAWYVGMKQFYILPWHFVLHNMGINPVKYRPLWVLSVHYYLHWYM